MNTDDLQDDAREGGARIEDLPASDNELLAKDREGGSDLRAPMSDPEEDPEEPEDVGSPSPRDPEA